MGSVPDVDPVLVCKRPWTTPLKAPRIFWKTTWQFLILLQKCVQILFQGKWKKPKYWAINFNLFPEHCNKQRKEKTPKYPRTMQTYKVFKVLVCLHSKQCLVLHYTFADGISVWFHSDLQSCLFSRWKCVEVLLCLAIWEGLTQVLGWGIAIKSSDYFALYVLVKGQGLYNKVLCSFPCYRGIAGTLQCVIIGTQILTSFVNVQIL